jgi:hypothetical protein
MSERIRAQTNLPQFVKGLASLLSVMQLIVRIWLFTVDLPKGDRPLNSTF